METYTRLLGKTLSFHHNVLTLDAHAQIILKIV